MGCCKHSGSKAIRADYSQQPLTLKFYARHDVMTNDRIKQMSLKFAGEIEKRISHDLRRKRFAPLSENQVYGWLEHCALHYASDDPVRQSFPRTTDEVLYMQAEIWRQSVKRA